MAWFKGVLLGLSLGAKVALTPAFAQDATPLTDPNFKDIPEDEGLIAAPNWLVGLHFKTKAAERRPIVFTYVDTLTPEQQLCLEATTIDGLYAATAQYSPKVQRQGRLELKYSTRFRTIWSDASLNNSGVVVSSGPCAVPANSKTILYPSFLNGQTDGLQSTENGDRILVLNIHARKTSEIEATFKLGEKDVGTPVCRKLEQPDAVKFNFTCEVALARTLSGMATFNYTRFYKGRSRDGEPAQIYLHAF